MGARHVLAGLMRLRSKANPELIPDLGAWIDLEWIRPVS